MALCQVRRYRAFRWRRGVGALPWLHRGSAALPSPIRRFADMFKEVTEDTLETFKIIYHQTTSYSNPIIETVLYQNKGGGMYYYGDLIDGNYLIFHRSGFAHINFNAFADNMNIDFFQEIDDFIKNNPAIPDYLLFYHTPPNLQTFWVGQQKKHFKIRRRRRYQLDEIQFKRMDRSLYAVPPGHKLFSLQECPYEDLEIFGLSLDTKFYDSREQFLRDSFGFVLYNDESKPVSISYLMCLVGRNSECDLKTLPDFRNNGYGYINITHYVRESILRKINVGWDCFVDNHSNKWIGQYGYTSIIREYDFVSFLK
jgi:hypothetical protein